jgi:hypothetical protein
MINNTCPKHLAVYPKSPNQKHDNKMYIIGLFGLYGPPHRLLQYFFTFVMEQEELYEGRLSHTVP